MLHFVKKLLKSILILSTLVAPVVFAETTLSDNDKNTTYLFVQYADSAVLNTVDANKGTYTLTLKNTPPHVSYFSDRPARKTGLLSDTEFFKLWQIKKNDSFGKVPPNVSVVGMKVHQIINEKDVFFTMTLSNPRYDQTKHTVTYDAKLVGSDTHAVAKKSQTLSHVVLFFDNWCPGCCCG